ncbi:MAG: EamA family transporter [Cloacibacillus sp.]
MKSAYCKYISALLLFGTNGIVASKIALPSYTIVFLRTLIGSLLLFSIFILTRNSFTFYKYPKQSFCLAISGIAMGLSWMFLYEAYSNLGVGIASLAYYCGPVIVMALSPLLFRERMTWGKTAGFLVVLIGIFLVNGQAAAHGATKWGVFCGAMSAVMYAFMVIFNMKSSPIAGLQNSSLQLGVSFLTVAVFVCLKQNVSFYVEPSDWYPIMILGLLNTGIGCYLYFSSIGELPVQTVAVCGYLEPLSAVAFSVIFLHEAMTPIQMAGGVMIIGGAMISERLKNKATA